jgi:hypothetical protein
LRTLLGFSGDGPLHQITPKQISAYLDGSRMSAYTWWREYQIIRSFFQFWLSRHKIAALPMPRPQAALPPPFRPWTAFLSVRCQLYIQHRMFIRWQRARCTTRIRR